MLAGYSNKWLAWRGFQAKLVLAFLASPAKRLKRENLAMRCTKPQPTRQCARCIPSRMWPVAVCGRLAGYSNKWLVWRGFPVVLVLAFLACPAQRCKCETLAMRCTKPQRTRQCARCFTSRMWPIGVSVSSWTPKYLTNDTIFFPWTADPQSRIPCMLSAA